MKSYVGSTDIVPSAGLDQILDTTLEDNGGSTYTHALVSGSPSIDAGPPPDGLSFSCPARPEPARVYGRSASGTTVCDIGAFEYGAADATAAVIDVGEKIKKPGTNKGKLKRFELAEPMGCGEDGETSVASRFIVRSGANPSAVVETDASWDCKVRKDGTVRKLER